jgi:uncharacterized protein YaaN involved in tellurite resistance
MRQFSYYGVIVRKEGVSNVLEFLELMEEWKLKNINSFEKLTKYVLIEFGEKKSAELALLYNPDKKEQQERFRELLGEFVQEFFKGTHCIRIGVGSNFNLRSN